MDSPHEPKMPEVASLSLFIRVRDQLIGRGLSRLDGAITNVVQ